MKTGDFGWLAFDYDAQRLEEIRLESFNTVHPATEVWVSLDRPGGARRAGASHQPLAARRSTSSTSTSPSISPRPAATRTG